MSSNIQTTQPVKPTPIKCRALTNEIRQLAIELFALGYTVRTIRQQVIDRLNVELSESQLMQLAIAEAPNVEVARRELSHMAISTGLADKGIRVARLGVLADAWARTAEVNEKAANVYLRALKQINEELEPLGLAALDPELDQWGRMINDLRTRKTPQLPAQGSEDGGAAGTT